jgi:hypothetical protein
MRKSKIWSALGLGVVAAGLAACDAGLTEANVNPNDPVDVTPQPLFVNGVREGVARYLGGANLRQFELLAQHLAEVQYPETDAYIRLSGASTEGLFDNAYPVELRDFQVTIRKGKETEAPGQWAPAMIMRTWEMGMITDAWGDVPYTEAFRGDSGTIAPKYDPQEQIYPMLFAALDTAVKALSSSANPGLGAADPIYAGSRPAWQRFGNSLRARHALRVVNVNPALADAELRAAFNGPGGLISSNAQTAQFTWTGGSYNNPWWTNFFTNNRDDHRVSNRLMDILQATADPRIATYAQPTEADPTKYAGLQNALTHAVAVEQLTTTSKPGARLYTRTQPSYLMTNAEVQFIQAEAAERSLGGLSPAQARGFYEAGITASATMWGATAAEIATFLARPEIAYKGGTEGLKQIATQKWVALYTDGLQAWSEWRRTCQPSTVRPGPAAQQNAVPRRLQYGPREETVNADNVNAAVARQGADAFTTRMWWDKNPTAAPTYEAGCGTK